MRGRFQRRPAGARHRALLPSESTAARIGGMREHVTLDWFPTWFSLVAVVDGKVQRLRRPAHHRMSDVAGLCELQDSRQRAKENPAAAGFSVDSSCCLEG